MFICKGYPQLVQAVLILVAQLNHQLSVRFLLRSQRIAERLLLRVQRLLVELLFSRQVDLKQVVDDKNAQTCWKPGLNQELEHLRGHRPRPPFFLPLPFFLRL